MQERLQKILANAGIASRREAEGFITSGRVAVNGMVVTELGTKADPDTDLITCDGKPVTVEERRVCILLYKPAGYMTTLKDPEGRPVVIDLLKDVPERVYPVGRLDYNTEGLLLLTNDGDLANRLMHPRHEVDKGYLVRVRGQVAPEQLRQLADGVLLDDGMTAPAQAALVKESENNSWISLTIHEGRFRQVRRMCEAVGLTVVRLKRSRYGFLEIGKMRPGEYRMLTVAEVEQLRTDPSQPPRKERPVATRSGTGPGKAGAGKAVQERPQQSTARPGAKPSGTRPSGRQSFDERPAPGKAVPEKPFQAGKGEGRPHRKSGPADTGTPSRSYAGKPAGKPQRPGASAGVKDEVKRSGIAKPVTTQRKTASGVIVRRSSPHNKTGKR
jgi:23S rRNA pseudouridine2605 synthase